MTYISSEAQTSAGILLRLRGRIASTVYYRRYFHNVAVIIQVTRDADDEKIIAGIDQIKSRVSVFPRGRP